MRVNNYRVFKGDWRLAWPPLVIAWPEIAGGTAKFFLRMRVVVGGDAEHHARRWQAFKLM